MWRSVSLKYTQLLYSHPSYGTGAFFSLIWAEPMLILIREVRSCILTKIRVVLGLALLSCALYTNVLFCDARDRGSSSFIYELEPLSIFKSYKERLVVTLTKKEQTIRAVMCCKECNNKQTIQRAIGRKKVM